ncbi:class I SAM-dependent methyltransferase [Methylovirgula sp. 4M-Z18]|uniref:class I SAM-dependent methyltransferase n=1 Tax=Methylovirgula sp. 4M-Z18 TaxID=2293567 RepID=UPI000E2E436F|nr:50S ribosomal protein L11 methyltransferase [Methylovirgula sp. 4M-Z18]RFB80558.1 methyltransferase [Methylovirgula sp. 4M-Z18]
MALDSHIAQLIRTHFPVVPVPSLPSIRLHRAGPKSGLWRLAEQDEEGFGTPYWAYVWGGGLVLAHYVRDHPEVVAGRKVLDLGTGSGLVAIAAAKAGAGEVVAADIDKYAMTAAALNAALNDATMAIIQGDMLDGPPPAVDLILIGDLFYAPELAERVLPFLDRCLNAHVDVLIGDPWRADLPRSRLQLVAEYPIVDFGTSARAEPQMAGVFVVA